MIETHLQKLRARDTISAEEERVIRDGVERIIRAQPDQVIVRENEPMDFSTILLTGIAARRKDLPDGRRQFTELHVPGDFTDIHSFTLKSLDHDIVAISPCTLAVIPHAHLRMITERFPHLTRIYWFGTNLDGAIHRAWVLSIGSRTALARMAHLFCEMFVRLSLVDLVRHDSYDLPLTQEELAEMLGITPVHANRTLQQLRRDNLVEFSGGIVTIPNLDALKRVGEFDPSYLYLSHQRDR